MTRPGRDTVAYLVHLCTIALAPLPAPLAAIFPGTGRLWLRADNGGEITELGLPDLDPEDARIILSNLLRDYSKALRGDGQLDDVPLDILEEVLAAGEESRTEDLEEAVGDLRRKAEETGRERVSKPERARRAVDPRIPADLRAQAERRVLPLLRWRAALVDANAVLGDAEDAE